MAPAPTLIKKGKNHWNIWTARALNRAPRGSTIPESHPSSTAFDLLLPSLTKGIETEVPSGKSWVAIPKANTHAASKFPAQTQLLQRILQEYCGEL
jgi:hypothetical protein